jgi:3',5'-cyclic-AMP phosphodiesterase
MNRRNFLRGSALAAGACALGRPADAQIARAPILLSGGGFTFAFFTDVHMEPAMDAPLGTALGMDLINASDAEFAICGGDHVFDALGANKGRILEQYALYADEEKALRMPVRHVLGNHDLAGLYSESGVSQLDPIFGKALFQKVFNTPTYYSFQHKGVNFIVLDSILIQGRNWKPGIDAAQLAWLERALAAAAGMPTIVITHVPLATSIANYCPGSNNAIYDPVANAAEVIPLLERHAVLAVLQGHIHIVENVQHHGIQFVSGGAVCGNWWRGPHYGDREGVTFVTVSAEGITTRYVPTGFVHLG